MCFLSNIEIRDCIEIVSAIGEIAIAAVIYWEWEANRLDQFLDDAGKDNSKRKEIFAAFCKIDCPPNFRRGDLFKQSLKSKDQSALKDNCDENIRLFSKVGARLSKLPALRNRVLDWHVVVFLWEILGPYVEERRSQAGPSFARTFLIYALASVERLLKQKRDKWTIVDPDVERGQNVILARARLVEMRSELMKELSVR